MKLNRTPLLLMGIAMQINFSYAEELPRITMRQFGVTAARQEVMLYSLVNAKGSLLEITNYGGIITRLLVPDRDGKSSDVVLGFNTLEEYLKDSPYFGCLVGRYGNRIANGQFVLEGKKYELAKNNEPGGMPCHLHGGNVGFDKVVWNATPVIENKIAGLKLAYLSRDGEEGYPGNLAVEVSYWWTNEDELKIEYRATTDKATPVNLSHHSYFHLKGEGSGDILDHVLMINAEKYTPVNQGLIPTGELAEVKGTPFDFSRPTAIGARIEEKHQQLQYGLGYDHNWVLKKRARALELAATVYEPSSGRVLEVWTTEPGLQFYSGNFLDGHLSGKSGKPHQFRHGFCLETQHFPDSPNQPQFPNVILKPGEKYESTTIYKFTSRKQ
ncbi:galactose mutarotase [candidate division KSB1 bacterium]|nr:galactose mutarotase [candidate division KSB1 bacterium]